MTDLTNNTKACSLVSMRKSILIKVAQAFDDEGIKYGVAHGLEAYPSSLGRDVDVLIKKSDRARALTLIKKIFSDNGLSVVVNKKPWAEWVVGYLDSPDGVVGVEIDTYSYMNWGWARLIKDLGETYAPSLKEPFVVDVWGGFVKRVLLQVLSGNSGRFCAGKKHADEFVIYDYERAIVLRRLSVFFGSGWAKALIMAIDASDLKWVVKHLKSIRVHLLWRGLFRPVDVLFAFLCWLQNEFSIHVFSRRNTPIIHLVGEDIGEALAVAEGLSVGLRKRFIFTSVEVENLQKRGAYSLRNMRKRRYRSTQLGLTVLVGEQKQGWGDLIRKFFVPVDLSLKIDSVAVSGSCYEPEIIKCFATMNAASGCK